MRVLYVTYDGLTDPIGQSQILPYLEGCAAKGHQITVISFEKPELRQSQSPKIVDRCRESGLTWLPQTFHHWPPILSKGFDLWMLKRSVNSAIRTDGPFDLIHARSYQAGWVALKLKQALGIPFLFDMRGFWADQRREGGRWRDSDPIGSRLFRQWKRREGDMLRGADHSVVLSEAARDEIMSWPCHGGQPVSVIPCCTDFTLFQLAKPEERRAVKASLGFHADAPVLAYLGSVGTVYRYDAHLRLFDRLRIKDPRVRMLHIGPDTPATIIQMAQSLGITLSEGELAARKADRDEVFHWLSAADVGTAFYTDTFYSKGVSPTKMGEYLAGGVPVIGNDQTGDTAALVHELSCGHTVSDFSDASLDEAASQFFRLLDCDREALRHRAMGMFDLSLAIKAYAMIYDSLTPLRLPVE